MSETDRRRDFFPNAEMPPLQRKCSRNTVRRRSFRKFEGLANKQLTAARLVLTMEDVSERRRAGGPSLAIARAVGGHLDGSLHFQQSCPDSLPRSGSLQNPQRCRRCLLFGGAVTGVHKNKAPPKRAPKVIRDHRRGGRSEHFTEIDSNRGSCEAKSGP
jgi:hypothetical protein